MMKKLLSLVVAALLTVSAVATSASAAKFTDVDATNDALNDAVELLVALNVTTGTSDTTYGTTENVTRAQMATFIYRMMKAGKHAPTGGANTTKFTDLDDPFYNFTIAWASDTGVIKGRNETTFDPKGGIILQDAYTMIVRALGHDDGTLSYPIGYITKAEELGLDENLDAKVNYDTTLTRGDVAIILANMFYAETSDSYIKYEAIDGDNIFGGFVPVEYFYTVAEKVFGLEKTSMKVIATPNYTFDIKKDGKIERAEGDVEMITLIAGPEYVDDYKDNYSDEVQSLGQYTIEFSELGLDGKADDYILCDILMFVKLDENDPTKTKIKEFFGATSQGVKKTVSFDDIEFGTVSGTTPEKYYDPDDKEFKKIDGMLTIDGVKAYFYDAPYSYSRDSKDYNKYNLQFITMGGYDGTADDGEKFINYVFDNNAPALKVHDQTCQVPNCTDASHDAFNHDGYIVTNGYLANIYYGGLGEVDVIDSNGDGRYDYFFKKEYSVAKVDAEEEEYVKDAHFDATAENINSRTIATDWSIVEGATFADKDVVLAYVNENANYIKIAEVLKKAKTEVVSLTEEYTELASGEKIYLDKLSVLTATAAKDFGASNTNAKTFGNKTVYTTADGEVVRIEGSTLGNIAYDTNWVIVLEAATKPATQLVDGLLEEAQYIKVIHDGAIKSIKARSYEEGYKCPVECTGTCEHVPATEVLVNGEPTAPYNFSRYVNKLATAKADSKGRYYFEIKVGSTTEANTFKSNMENKDDATKQSSRFGGSSATTKFYNKTGNIFELTDAKSYLPTLKGVYVNEGTQIIIKSQEKGTKEPVINVYSYENLPDIDESISFKNFSYVLQNNVNGTSYENLVVFYGEYAGELKGAKGEVAEVRIVAKAPAVTKVDDEDVFTYTLYNPFTAKLETAEGYENDRKFNAGDVVTLTKNGYVDDTVAKYGSLLDSEGAGNWYNASEMIGDSNFNNDDLGWKYITEFDANANVLVLNGASETFVTTEETVVCFIDLSTTSTFKALSLADLASTKDAYREDDRDYKDNDDNDQTDDGQPLKAFVCAEEIDNFDRNDPTYVVNFAVIVRD